MKKYNKVTLGFVVQNYEIIKGVPTCVRQDFIAGDVDYENKMGDNITDQVDTINEQYFGFDMKQPPHISPDSLEFVCPDCGCNRLECIFDGHHLCQITNINTDGDFDYGEYHSEAYPTKFQCVECASFIKDVSGKPITDNLEVVKWIKDSCK